jgi:inorganic triphosphatase YgiF
LVDLLSDGTFLGLFSIAIGVFSSIVIFAATNSWQQKEVRKAYEKTQTTLDEISKYFKSNALYAVEEKIGVLNRHRGEVKDWTKEDVEINLDRITSDIRAVVYLKDLIDAGQKERLNAAIRKLKDAIKEKGFDPGRIDDVSKPLG